MRSLDLCIAQFILTKTTKTGINLPSNCSYLDVCRTVPITAIDHEIHLLKTKTKYSSNEFSDAYSVVTYAVAVWRHAQTRGLYVYALGLMQYAV